MEFDNLVEFARFLMKDKPNPFAILLEGRWNISSTYKKRRDMLKDFYIRDIFEG